ncbi:unnamed protein product [Fraxinus pennsylvanica]|uniref:Protein kinase domain-containing protein n=1 Tax=Fraxinus pennsylvanica TaxID=56036 RepID=A0AAD1ZKZ8_9LAMI|nr:unnamed protein product [Fraxinus pennsylvanica]
MAGQVVSERPTSLFEFELVEDDSGDSSTIIASSNQINPWIDPATIKLRHRIGRRPFGDVWLATHHSNTEHYEEYHEVAIKMLHPVKEDNIRDVLNKLDNLLSRCRGLENICWLHGLSIINLYCYEIYEGSVGDKMARYKGGKLSLSDVLRYGADLAQGIMDLHAKDILILNLKPFNFLLNENDRAILGDIGIPHVLLGVSLTNTEMTQRLGTPNYMAPEQWEPEMRGPISRLMHGDLVAALWRC